MGPSTLRHIGRRLRVNSSRVRKLFVILLLLAVGLLLIEVHFLADSDPDAPKNPRSFRSQERDSTKVSARSQKRKEPARLLKEKERGASANKAPSSGRQKAERRRKKQDTIVTRRPLGAQKEQESAKSHKNQDTVLQHGTALVNMSHDKWIILDVTSGLCKGKIYAPPGWKILAGNQAEGDNTHTLVNLPPGPGLGPNSSDDTGQLWRKNEAYMAAIAQGAVEILETDCSVPLTKALHALKVQGRKYHGLLYNETLLFNPYAHFGAWALAPRAALHTGLWNNSRLYYVRDFHNVPIQHVVSVQSTDAVVVLHRGHGEGVKFDPSSPSVYLGQRSFSPLVPGCSLYHRDAFWALLVPCVSSSQHCQVLRLFIQQRLLRELDAFSGYYQVSGSFAGSDDSQNSHSVGGTSLKSMLTFLNAWKCEDDFQFFQCFSSLVSQLNRKGFISNVQRKLMTDIISSFKTLGVAEAIRVKVPWRGVRKVGEFRVKMGSVRTYLESGGTANEQFLSKSLQDPVKNRCDRFASVGLFPTVKQWKSPVIEDVVLIVVFNKVMYFWRNIPFLESMYRPYFKHMAYCVTDLDLLLSKSHTEIPDHMTLVEGLTSYWYVMYGCTTVLMQMNLQGVRGYLQIGDDTLLNPWRLFNTSHDVIFMDNFGMKINAEHFFVRPHWKWWRTSYGRCPLLNSLAELEEISGLSKRELLKWAGTSAHVRAKHRRNTFSEIREADKKGRKPPVTYCPTLPGSEIWKKPTQKQAKRFLYNYYLVHNMSGYIVGKAQDFFYLPQALAEDYVAISHLFMRNQVMVEIGLHAIQLGISGRGVIQKVYGSSLWHTDRYITGAFFNTSHFYLHPFKMKYTFREELRKFYCDVYLKILFTRLKSKGAG